MNYTDIIDYIFASYPMYHKIGSSAYKEGLENIEILADIVQHPEKKIRSVHVAGSNGKGSVSHLLASWFQESGYKTGLYTSPHLVNFRERIRINGEMITEKEVVDFFNRHQHAFDSIEPSFFEMTTILAFDYFAQQQVDVAVIETGLGGRLDATNIILPKLSVITNISLEHTQLLGDTLAQIAAEKGGIIKSNVPVVIGEYHPETYPVFQTIAQEKQSPLYLAEDHYRVSFSVAGSSPYAIDTFRDNKLLFKNIDTPLQGIYQHKNIATFLQATEIAATTFHPIRQSVEKAAIENVIDNTHLQGRWQILKKLPLTICDVGHNAGGLSYNMQQLFAMPHEKLHIILGFVDDKDVAAIIKTLPNVQYYLCSASIDRAMPQQRLATFFDDASLSYIMCRTVANAYNIANSVATNNDIIFIGGSCFVVGELLANLNSVQ